MTEYRVSRGRVLFVSAFVIATMTLGFVLDSEGFYDWIPSEVVFALSFVGVAVFLARDLHRFWKRRQGSN